MVDLIQAKQGSRKVPLDSGRCAEEAAEEVLLDARLGPVAQVLPGAAAAVAEVAAAGFHAVRGGADDPHGLAAGELAPRPHDAAVHELPGEDAGDEHDVAAVAADAVLAEGQVVAQQAQDLPRAKRCGGARDGARGTGGGTGGTTGTGRHGGNRTPPRGPARRLPVFAADGDRARGCGRGAEEEHGDDDQHGVLSGGSAGPRPAPRGPFHNPRAGPPRGGGARSGPGTGIPRTAAPSRSSRPAPNPLGDRGLNRETGPSPR